MTDFECGHTPTTIKYDANGHRSWCGDCGAARYPRIPIKPDPRLIDKPSGWVRRRGPSAHECNRPLTTEIGDLWRCQDPDCRWLWRVGDSCDFCDRWTRWYGETQPHLCSPYQKWRPARLWQRIRYWFSDGDLR